MVFHALGDELVTDRSEFMTGGWSVFRGRGGGGNNFRDEILGGVLDLK